VRALEFYGMAPTIIVPDNPKVGVTRADRYEPQLQRSYEELAAHYGAVIIPARPYRPKDKSRVELSVLLVYRWILARLRHQRFFSLDELNAAIRPLLSELNERAFQRLPGCRRSIFEALDRPAMRPLPEAPYSYAEWREQDDWGLTALSAQDRADLLEILHDRIDAGSTLIASQLPVDTWHAYLGEPTHRRCDPRSRRPPEPPHRPEATGRVDAQEPGDGGCRSFSPAGRPVRPRYGLAAEHKEKSKSPLIHASTALA
jgi:hypothetical protein